MGTSLFLSFLMISFLFLVILIKVESAQETLFEIDAFTNQSLILTYQRDAFVPPDETYLQLVPAYASDLPAASVGRVLYTAPLEIWDTSIQHVASFETNITLRVTPYNSTHAYDGMTFFVVPVNSTSSQGGASTNLGIYDALQPADSPFLAVEFDYIKNVNHGPHYNHIGININSPISQNFTKLEDSLMGQLVTARIAYDAHTGEISVVATDGSSTAAVSFYFNLRAVLPQQVQVGLSASTGSAVDAAYFDVYTWHFKSTMVPVSSNSVTDA